MRAKTHIGFLISQGMASLAVGVIVGMAGCGSSTGTVAPVSQPGSTTTNSDANATAKSTSTTISPELVQKVTDLVRLHKEYAAMAQGVQSFDEFKKQSDALSGLEQQISSLVEDIMIAEAKLSAAEKAEFDSKYYTPAKPAIDEQRRQKARITALIP